MSFPRVLNAQDGNAAQLKREETLHRSLRECTTRRLTHFFPCDMREHHNTPLLTSRVQWNSERTDSEPGPAIDDDHEVQQIEERVDEYFPSPVLSEIDELTTSDGEHSLPASRPSTGLITGFGRTLGTYNAVSDDGSSYRTCSESSDTERRQPSFPGNRDIIDSRYPSNSPSPSTRHNAQLLPPSPTSDVSSLERKGWKSSQNRSHCTSSVGLHIHSSSRTPSREDRNDRIGLWRVDSTPSVYHAGPSSLGRYTANGLSSSANDLRLTYSSSASASSVPPSPPPVLPPIRSQSNQQHLQSLSASLGRAPGGVQWRVREPTPPTNHKRFSPHDPDSADEFDMADTASSAGSPRNFPGLLHSSVEKGSSSIPLTIRPYPPSGPPRNKNAWKDHANQVVGANDQTEFRCVWRVANTGAETDVCGYTAKRHLVKRHVETRHLQFKDHVCQYCGKAFPQRVSLMIHVNRHTGEKPHRCRYEDCDKTFSDPARRHKHMVEAHGYNPQGPRKRHRTTDSYHTNSHFETLAPWAAKPDGAEDSATENVD